MKDQYELDRIEVLKKFTIIRTGKRRMRVENKQSLSGTQAKNENGERTIIVRNKVVKQSSSRLWL